MLRLTIGLPSYANFTEVFFTVQALRIYHDLTSCEILIVDNFGDLELEKFWKAQGRGIVRYEKYTDCTGPAGAKNAVFELARGEMVLCLDSHVLLIPGALKNIPVTDDLIHGPLLYNDMRNYVCDFKPVWRGHMLGIWGDYCTFDKLPKEPFEIWGSGMGCFLAKKSTWLGFPSRYRGFGSEEGIIHEKYRKAGRKVLCLPSLVWVHQFDKPIPYPLHLIDRVRNYLIGYAEIGLDPQPIVDHFGEKLVEEARAMLAKEEKEVPVTSAPIIISSTPPNYEMIQEKFCSNSRSGNIASRMGQRLTKNVMEADPFFKNYGNNLPILDIGCGDAWGLECFKNSGFKNLYGIEIVQSRIDVALKYGFTVYKGMAEDTIKVLLKAGLNAKKFNVFCSHVLENCVNQGKVVENLKKISNIIWIVVCVEPNGTANKSHYSPVKNLDQIANYFDSTWTCLKKEERFNLETEAVIGFVKKTGT